MRIFDRKGAAKKLRINPISLPSAKWCAALIALSLITTYDTAIATPTWRIGTKEAAGEATGQTHEIELDLYAGRGVTILLTEINMRAIDVFIDDNSFISVTTSPPLCNSTAANCTNNEGALIVRVRLTKDIYQVCHENHTEAIAIKVPPPPGVGGYFPAQELPPTAQQLKCDPIAHSEDGSTRLTIMARSSKDSTIKVFSFILRPKPGEMPPDSGLSKVKIVPEAEKILPTIHLHPRGISSTKDE